MVASSAEAGSPMPGVPLPAPSPRTPVFRGALLLVILLISLAASPTHALAQASATATPMPAGQEPPQAPDRVEVEPVAQDDEIAERLQGILEATHWFTQPEVRVQDGVVFLSGSTSRAEYRTWAGDLARRTQDVAAVVNQIEVAEPSVWDIEPALAGVRDLWRGLVRAIPVAVVSLLILGAAWAVSGLAARLARRFLAARVSSRLLRNVMSQGAALLVMLAGLTVVFHVAGLTSLALTLVGGTGLLGLILGIAFRDITENFLASIFLSLQNPFRIGDLVEVHGIQGFVQLMTTRVTVLLTPDGTHVQIPNATIYKSSIRNFTSNPNRRDDFTIGIGYQDSITAAQEVALQVLSEHPSVLKEPEPWVLVDSLGSSTVVLRVYFWLDSNTYGALAVRSSVIRLVKRAFQAAGVSMPDEAREVVFPEGIPVRMVEPEGAQLDQPTDSGHPGSSPPDEAAVIATTAEGNLLSEAAEVQHQARTSRPAVEGENLLRPAEPPPTH